MDNFFKNQENSSNPFNTSDSEFDLEFEGSDNNPLISDKQHRLNDYDSNLFSSGAYKGIDDEMFQIEYKINRLENKIKSLQSGIITAKAVKDKRQLCTLLDEKNQYEKELQGLYRKYNGRSLPAKLSGGILKLLADIPGKSADFLHNILNFINSGLFTKISEKFTSNMHIKEALVQLESINKNVDELVSMQAPYGETPAKYDRLLQYLNTANNIQYQISRMVHNSGKQKNE